MFKICTILVEHLPLGFSSERKKWGTVLVVVFIQIENWGLRTRCLSFFIKKMIVDIKLELVHVTTCCRKEEQHLSCSIVKKPQKQGSCFFVFFTCHEMLQIIENFCKMEQKYCIIIAYCCKNIANVAKLSQPVPKLSQNVPKLS